ncbi:hypothetical protein SH1V18_27510 [Vallitalea longa]|uniref:SLH domain-containing protein n=1 Tax=Vallitalea longa TaxID=2936439 RepID=A0A9W6DEK2_9FIRM|nr:WG repeat-containing protein [Vallitalea longa]GKX30271.1 hypothetical protein SH1V18_27510 [Vallitalea longa]
MRRLKILLFTVLLVSTSINVNASSSYLAIDADYSGTGSFSEGLAEVSNNSKWGYIDTEGNLKIPFCYDITTPFRKGRALVVKDGKRIIIDKNGVEYTPSDIDTCYQILSGFIYGLEDAYFGFDRDNKKGLMDKYGKKIIPSIYEDFQSFHDGLVVAYDTDEDENTQYTVYDKHGNIIVPEGLYDYINDYNEGLTSVTKDNQYAVIDTEGNVVIPFGEYSSIGTFYEGLASAKKNGKRGFINSKGEIIVPFIYDYMWLFNDGFTYVKKNKKYGLIDKKGNEVIPCEYDSLDYLGGSYENIVLVGKGGQESYFIDDPYLNDRINTSNKKFGFINTEGKNVTPITYDYAELFYNGFAKVAIGGNGGSGKTNYCCGKFGFIDLSGKEVVPLIYDHVGEFSSYLYKGKIKGTVPVSIGGYGSVYSYKGGRWGYVDEKGNKITELIYDEVYDFHEGYGKVLKDGKYGFVDINGDEVIPCIYSQARDFQGGLAMVVYDGRGEIIDINGNEIFPEDFAILRPYKEGYARVSTDGSKFGYVDNPSEQVKDVHMSLKEGKYDGTKTITLSCDTEGAQIYYSIKYNKNYISFDDVYGWKYRPYLGPIVLNQKANITAYAVKKGMKESKSVTSNYEIIHNILPTDEKPFYNKVPYNMYADLLNNFGLFNGTAKGYELDKSGTRVEGLVMFLRLIGEEKEALESLEEHPFTDVPKWADRYVAYAYSKGYTNGVSETTFGSNSIIDAKSYFTFLLRALNYSDKDGDFKWNNSIEYAVYIDIISNEDYDFYQKEFKRAEIVKASYNTLFTKIKNTEKTLYDILREKGIIKL